MEFIAHRAQCATDIRRAGPARGLPVLVLALALALASPRALLAGEAAAGPPPDSLATRAQSADLVALVKVVDTDYLRRRDIPVSGSAYLEVLIPYKPHAPGDRVEVYEKGLHEDECYFPNPSVFEEGRRYLVFLRRDPENAARYRGLPGGCAIDVLVDRDNRYAVRMPVTGLRLPDAQRERLRALAQPLAFADPYAVVEDEALPPALRDAMMTAGQIEPHEPAKPSPHGTSMGETPLLARTPATPTRWIYTRGVPLEKFRKLLRLEPGGRR